MDSAVTRNTSSSSTSRDSSIDPKKCADGADVKVMYNTGGAVIASSAAGLHVNPSGKNGEVADNWSQRDDAVPPTLVGLHSSPVTATAAAAPRECAATPSFPSRLSYSPATTTITASTSPSVIPCENRTLLHGDESPPPRPGLSSSSAPVPPPPPPPCRPQSRRDTFLWFTSWNEHRPSNEICTSKYSITTFVPKFLLEQFRRLSNVYFLFILAINFIPGVSPNNPFSAVFPLGVVLCVAAVKDGIEDLRRHQSDRAANAIHTHVLQVDGSVVATESRSVKVGDVLVVRHGEELRADCVLLGSSLPDGLAYIETMNLDGETNAKTRRAPSKVVELFGTVEKQVLYLRTHLQKHAVAGGSSGAPPPPGGVMDSEEMHHGGETSPLVQLARTRSWPRVVSGPPTMNLYSFQGKLILPTNTATDINRTVSSIDSSEGDASSVVPLSIDQFLPRGCVLRNTEWALCLVIHTGVETKMMMNLVLKPAKVSMMTGVLNHLNIWLFCLQQIVILIACGLSVYFNRTMMSTTEKHWYVAHDLHRLHGVQLFFWRYLTFLISFSSLIPISLYISLELVKAMQVALIARDPLLAHAHPVTGVVRFTRPKTSNLNVELSQVQYLFTDKTGTLTENSMKFHSGHVNCNMFFATPEGLHDLRATLFAQVGEAFRRRRAMHRTLSGSAGRDAVHIRRKSSLSHVFSRVASQDIPANVASVPPVATLKDSIHAPTSAVETAPLLHRSREEEAPPPPMFPTMDGVLRRIQSSSLRLSPRHDRSATEDFTLQHHFKHHKLSARMKCLFWSVLKEESLSSFMASASSVLSYFLVLSLCHGVVPFERTAVVTSAVTSPKNTKSQHSGIPEARVAPTTAAASSDVTNHQVSHHSLASSEELGNARSPPSPHAPRLPQTHLPVSYEGASLDEVALVEAAAREGFVLSQRSSSCMVIELFDSIAMSFDVALQNEFTPDRKRMSILLKRRALTNLVKRSSPISVSMVGLMDAIRGGSAGAGVVDDRPPFPTLDTVETFASGDARNSSPVFSNSLRRGDDEEEEYLHNFGAAEYLLLVKGADSSMFPVLDQQHYHHERCATLYETLTKARLCVDEMGQCGLRTLVLAYRCVSEEVAQRWIQLHHHAQCSLEDREGLLHDAAEEMERSLILVGATAVEDKLQDGVPETIAFLSRCGMIVWMLTGDKRETAVTIAENCGLVNKSSILVHLDMEKEMSMRRSSRSPAARGRSGGGESVATSEIQSSSPRSVSPIPGLQHPSTAAASCRTNPNTNATEEDEVNDKTERYASCKRLLDEALQLASFGTLSTPTAAAVVLVVDGCTLHTIFDHPDDLLRMFFDLSRRCRSAVCCRMTPLQKADIVRIFQTNLKDKVCLAIGDGANDVSMIQEARIGIGIMGVEGSQAELASDFAIPKFRHLRRLLAVYGRQALYREAMVAFYSVYKTMLMCVIVFCLAFQSAFTGSMLIDSWLLSATNLIFLSLPALLIGAADKDVPDELAETVPQLYVPLSRENTFLDRRARLRLVFNAFTQGVAIYFTANTFMSRGSLHPVLSMPVEAYGALVFITVVLVCNLQAFWTIRNMNSVTWGGMIFNMMLLPSTMIAYSLFHAFGGSNWMVGIAMDVWRSRGLWMCIAFSCAGMLPVFLWGKGWLLDWLWPAENSPGAFRAAKRAWKLFK